ncbi:hypothetical protein D3C72_966190 [compost metagenome]
MLGAEARHGFRREFGEQCVARQLIKFEAHAAAVAEEGDLADFGREQVFLMHQRIDVDRFRAAEQSARGAAHTAIRQTHIHPANPGVAGAAALERQPVTLADKLGHERRGRAVVDFLRRGVLLDLAVVHHGDAVGHQHGFVLIVRDHQRGDAEVALQLAQLGAQMLADAGVEGGHRFVEQQQRRCRRQSAGQRDALLLAAGQLAGVLFLAAGEADQFEHLADALAHFVAPAASKAVGNIRLDGQIGEQCVGLEQNPVVAGLRGEVRDIAIAEVQLAAVLLFQTGDATQQRGLAAARRAEQAHQLTGGDVEGHIIQRGESAEAFLYAAHFHRRTGVGQGSCDGRIHGQTSSSR